MSTAQGRKELLLEELREAVEHLGYRLRFEMGDFQGGACILREQRLILVNKRATIERKLIVIAQAIGAIGIDGVYLKPAVRGYVEDELARARNAK
jgi:hypothetical protein